MAGEAWPVLLRVVYFFAFLGVAAAWWLWDFRQRNTFAATGLEVSLPLQMSSLAPWTGGHFKGLVSRSLRLLRSFGF